MPFEIKPVKELKPGDRFIVPEEGNMAECQKIAPSKGLGGKLTGQGYYDVDYFDALGGHHQAGEVDGEEALRVFERSE